jgi:PRTRC genetic system protein B
MNQQQQTPRQMPRLRLDFYNTAVLMSRWEDDGRVTAYPVSIHDVVAACADRPLSSGLLPPNVLFWKRQAGDASLAVYVPARRWRARLDGGGNADPIEYHLPLPPFVFVGDGAVYRIFAVKGRSSDERERLYRAPCPNVHNGGAICQGNAPFPACSPQTIQAALTLFMEGSLFNGDLSRLKCRAYPDDVRRLWAELDGRKRFPLSELLPTRITLADLLRGNPMV